MSKHAYSLIAFDLDGTLLRDDKSIPQENLAALEKAAARGITLAPATGRIFRGLPPQLKELPFLRYFILSNGAAVYDRQEQRTLVRADIPLELALRCYEYLDTLPVIYDCYMDSAGWMTEALQRRAADFAPDRHYLHMLRELRTPVPELKDFIAARGHDVQKIQFFTRDLDLRDEVLRTCDQRFPGTVASASCPNNVEINAAGATKGLALAGLCRALDIDPAQTLAFGDGLNDVSMLRAAGIGVAMGNAGDAVKAAADEIAPDCDHDGVAAVVGRFFPEA